MARTQTILIIGAGVAGLAAAQALSARDFSVIVLEARNRIGGRIWTIHEHNDLALDLGAQWIVGTVGNPILDRARHLHLATFQTDWHSLALHSASGKRIRNASQLAIESRLQDLLSDVNDERARNRAAGNPDRSLGEAVTALLARKRLTARQRMELDFVISTDIEHELATDLADLSLYHWDGESRLEGGELLLPGGYDQIVTHLASELDIRTRHVVTQVVAGARGVSVITNRGIFLADRCLVTVPLGVLRRGAIAFTPALPSAQGKAMRNLHMGTLNKVFLRFPDAFWPEEHILGQLTSTPGEWPWFINLLPSSQRPVLLGLNAGSYALRLETFSDEMVVKAAMRVLRRWFGQRVPEPNAWHITRWASDPFAFGSYAHVPPGASSEDIEQLAQPLGDRVFFAGEATAQLYGGTVHGAYMSGLREATRIASV